MSLINHLLCDRRTAVGCIVQQCWIALVLGPGLGLAQQVELHWGAVADEALPPPTPPAAAAVEWPADCPPQATDRPLSQLNADIRARNTQDGQPVPVEGLPPDCAKYVFTKVQHEPMLPSCSSHRPNTCDLLQLARFSYRPLYFEEPLLERYGIRSCCCQPAASALHFYGSALLMPVKIVRQCPCEDDICPDPCW